MTHWRAHVLICFDVTLSVGCLQKKRYLVINWMAISTGSVPIL